MKTRMDHHNQSNRILRGTKFIGQFQFLWRPTTQTPSSVKTTIQTRPSSGRYIKPVLNQEISRNLSPATNRAQAHLCGSKGRESNCFKAEPNGFWSNNKRVERCSKLRRRRAKGVDEHSHENGSVERSNELENVGGAN